MDKKEFEFLLKQGEGYNLEFKESFYSDISKEICAFANAVGGKILIGVTDNKKIKGIKITNRLKSQVHDLVRNFDPKLEITMEEFNNILIINIPEGKNKPFSVNGKFYVRQGTNSQQLSRDEIRDFFISEGLITFDEKINEKFDIQKDVSTEAYNNFLELSRISKLTKKENLFENLSLLKSGKMKNAGVLLFAKDVTRFITPATITCLTFLGTERLKISDRKEFGENLHKNFEHALTYLKEKLNTEYIIRTAGPREEKLELPEEALREALLNAIGHKDYFSNASVFVEIYSDRVEITNPGGLVKGLDKKDLGKKSMPRNRLLFRLMQRMDLVEEAGTGIKRIKDAMTSYKLKGPKFEISKDWFTVIFDRPKNSYEERIFGKEFEGTRGVEKGVEKGVERLSDKEEKIIKLIREDPNISKKEIMQKGKLSKKTVEYNIEKLKEKGLLKRIGPDKGGHWQVIK